jgi:dTMP kinase
MKKGFFLVLDGNDGSGKATQTELLRQKCEAEGIVVEKFDFPAYGRSMFGSLIGDALAGKHGNFVGLDPHIASTLYAVDRFEAKEKMCEALAQGKLVIADRFVSSNQIHQGGKIENENERIDFLTWLDRMEHEVLAVPRPDAIIYLKVPVETSLKLLSEKRMAKNGHLGDGEKDQVENDRNYLDRSRATADWLAARQSNWTVVDCTHGSGHMRSREDIHEEIMAAVLPNVSPAAQPYR